MDLWGIVLVLNISSSYHFGQTGQDIVNLLQHYRSSFPEQSVPPKLHFLEDHMVDFLEMWKVGLGLLGEQGLESIHSDFNKLAHKHHAIKPADRRLECMMKAHLIDIFPKAQALKPKINKRKSSMVEE